MLVVMELGIALDGEGRLGRPGAVGALARAADRLDYRTVWCIGPWAATLAGGVAAVTSRVRIGVERRAFDEMGSTCADGRDRLVVVDDLLVWRGTDGRPGAASVGSRRLDVRVSDLAGAAPELLAAGAAGVDEIVVRLVGDPGVDDALAAYAELAGLVEASGSAEPSRTVDEPPNHR